MTHRLSPLFSAAGRKGAAASGGPARRQACDGCLDGPLGVLRRRLFVPIFQPVYSLWPAADVNKTAANSYLPKRMLGRVSPLC